MSKSVALHRARNRGTEGAGLAVDWEMIPDAADCDIARDWIAADTDGFMWRLAEGSTSSAWVSHEGRAVKLAHLPWAQYTDCVCAWSWCEVPRVMMGGAAKAFVARDLTPLVSSMVRTLLQTTAEVEPRFAEDGKQFLTILDAADALALGREKTSDVQRALNDGETASLRWRNVRDSFAWDAALSVGKFAVDSAGNRSWADLHMEHVGSYLGMILGTKPATNLVRRFVTPDMVFSALARRAVGAL